MRKKILFANWKMNKNINESEIFIDELFNVLDTIEKHKMDNIILGIAPTFLALPFLVKKQKNNVCVISQNAHFLEKGAYTGEISVKMLHDIGVNYAIIGHSERRNYYNETNKTSNLKIKELLSKKMTPIYCCGETIDIYKSGQTCEYIKKQILEGLNGISSENINKIIIAYEPIWSIGSGKNMSADEANKICIFIRKIIKEKYNSKISENTCIIYGGSVKSDNVKMYLKYPDIDGFLVGSASLEIESFKKILFNML